MDVAARPRSVSIAFLATLASVVLALIEWVDGLLKGPAIVTLFDVAVEIAVVLYVVLYAFLAYRWYRRGRLAWRIYLTLVVAMLAFQAFLLTKLPPETWDAWVLTAGYSVLDIAILVLLLGPSARSWFGPSPSSQGAP